MPIDPGSLARELADAYAARQTTIVPPSSRDASFDMATAYAVEAELVRMRRAAGHTSVGLKVGFANKALWRVLKLETLAWAHMYDDTVRYPGSNAATLSVARMASPKIEPEIVFKLRRPIAHGLTGPAEVLAAVEWLALGFEIIDCVYADWRYQPADFVAAYGLHAALVVGEPVVIAPRTIPALVEELPRFKVRLLKNGRLEQEGWGRNALRSPASCLAELAGALSRQPGAEALAAGALVSTGTLTDSQPLAAGDTWRAEIEGLDLPPLSLAAR